MKFVKKHDESGQKFLEVNVKGYELINNSVLNKGRSFTPDERAEFDLYGILPSAYFSLDEIVDKNYQIVMNTNTDLDKHIYLRNLQDRNETLFYALLNKYIEDIMPLIYTPTVGSACQNFAHIYRKSRGLFISYPDIDKIDTMLAHEQLDETDVIVVSDGERILGLGDQGAGGMGISIGKLSLYTACAGIPPHKTLPIVLDVGTDNETLLDDPLYLGWRNKRIRGQKYDDFINAFINAVKKRFPKILLHWEDFAQNNALRLLNKYREQLCTFNDDIQGTASVVVGSLLSACKSSGIELSKQKIIVVGAGSAGVGISNLILEAIVNQGVTREEAYRAFFLVDRSGLITDHIDSLDFQKPFSRSIDETNAWNFVDRKNITLLETVQNAKATMIIGVCAQGGIFNKDVIEALAANCEKPIVFPLSNPTEKAEANPHDVLNWTNEKAIVGTGTAFPKYQSKDGLKRIDQVNNSYIFPGIGLGAIVVGASKITDKMFLIAAEELARFSPVKSESNYNFLPPLTEVRNIARNIAFKVAKEAVNSGLTSHESISDECINSMLDDYIWNPVYLPYKYTRSI